MTIEEAMEWCAAHEATVSFYFVARTFAGKGAMPRVKLSVGRLGDASAFTIDKLDFITAVQKAQAAEEALR